MQSLYKANCLIFLIFFLGNALHLHDVSSDYINFLQIQQNTIQTKLDSLSQKISQNNKTLQNENDINKRITLLETFLRQQRLLLSEIHLETVDEQLNSSEWVCATISNQKKIQINNILTLIDQDLSKIGQVIDKLDENQLGPGINSFKQQIKNAKTTSVKLRQELASTGTQVNPSSIKLQSKTNLNAPNWALDDKKIEQLNQEYKKVSQAGNLQICNIKEPFFSSKQNKCLTCNEQNSIFSLKTQECKKCLNFDMGQHKCKDSASTNILPTTQNKIIVPQGKTLQGYKDKFTQIVPCPQKTPFYTGKQCIQCEAFFDIQNKVCRKCDGEDFYDNNTHTCKNEKNLLSNFQTNPEKTANLIFEGHPKNQWLYIYYQNIEKNEVLKDCPEQRPYFDGKSCINCSEESPYFNMEYKKCQKCSEGTKYDNAHHQCLTSQGNIVSQVPTLQKMAAGIFA